MILSNICFYRPEHGARLYHCIVYTDGTTVTFDAPSMENLETILRYWGVDTRLHEGWFQAKHFWLYDIPLFPERG